MKRFFRYVIGPALVISLTAVAILVQQSIHADSIAPYSTRALPQSAPNDVATDQSAAACHCVVMLPVQAEMKPSRAVGVIVAFPSADDPRKVTLKWSAIGADNVEVRVGRPDGDLFAYSPAETWETGEWAADGLVFYLQDVTGGRPLLKENTIATLTIRR
jgi:hypothetical protein